MPVIEVEHLQKRYRDLVAVDDVSFTVERGEVFGVLGPNGAGKTTTVEIIEGLRTADSGTVRVLGRPIATGPSCGSVSGPSSGAAARAAQGRGGHGLYAPSTPPALGSGSCTTWCWPTSATQVRQALRGRSSACPRPALV